MLVDFEIKLDEFEGYEIKADGYISYTSSDFTFEDIEVHIKTIVVDVDKSSKTFCPIPTTKEIQNAIIDNHEWLEELLTKNALSFDEACRAGD